MTNVDTTTPATVAKQGAHVAPAKASSQKQATAQKGAPKARKSAKAAKPKKDARKIATPPTQEAGPRTGSKSAKVLSLLARPNGASLPELIAYASHCTSPGRCEGFSLTKGLFDNLTPLLFCGGLGPGFS
jgi:hypothetical protein